MVKVFSWILVICFIFMIISGIITTYTLSSFLGSLIVISPIIMIISAIGLIITLILERKKDKKEEEKNDFSKY